MNIVFLYTELADYTIACMRQLSRAPGVQLLVIHYPVNKEAPFQFDTMGIGEFIPVTDFNTYPKLETKVKSFIPSIIVSSGWINKNYLRICWKFRRMSINVLTLDNHFKGHFKQRLFTALSPITLKQVFHFCWVPGAQQKLYAGKLGFSEGQIRMGFYCCDIDRFNRFYTNSGEIKSSAFPKRFLSVARYVPQKGYQNLWKAFIQWKELEPNDWELWCAGTGEGWNDRVRHAAIKHLGFVQRDQWSSIIQQTTVFVLNSSFEPWGVAVHEFAAAGYPLILSRHVGAAAAFTDTENGLMIDPDDISSIIAAFRNIASRTDAALEQMAQHSHQLAQQITPAQWADTLINLSTSN